ncbi:MAG TPA: DUF5615 family PIN-like protein [Bacteroidia bacterium]|nr:DUF5615 family PIN-like protein [Bacteroidia bacterium]
MKLLFDQNISPKIVKQLESSFPGSKHVLHVGLQDQSDLAIFEYAKENGYTIVTFDSDFVDLNLFRGFPPKLIWLKTGNLTTRFISELLKQNVLTIQNFVTSEEKDILEILTPAT